MRQRLVFSILSVLLFLFSVQSSVLAQNLTADGISLDGFVNDYAGIISQEDQIEIENLLDELYANGTAQVAIVTVRTLNGEPIEDFSMKIAHGKLGDSGKDNGLLYLIAVDDRQYRIEVGYGLEDKIPDAIAGRIGRKTAEDYFSEGKYSEGILYATGRFYDLLKGNSTAKDDENLSERLTPAMKNMIFVLALLIPFSIFFMIAASLRKDDSGKQSLKNKRSKKKNDD